MSDLLLKATPSLLDGWCGPVSRQIPECDFEPGPFAWPSEQTVGWVLHCYSLDLSRAECRDRVARLLRRNKYGLQLWLDGHRVMVSAKSATAFYEMHDLDPNDDTRLPDGSRLVDAQALLLVAREVLK